MEFRYHGNYCGPNWSNGRYGPSVRKRRGNLPPIDALDEACMDHDDAYARGYNLDAADLKFARDTFGLGFKGFAASVGVGSQGILRSTGILPKNIEIDEMAPTPKRIYSSKTLLNTPQSMYKRRRYSSGSSSKSTAAGAQLTLPINQPGAYSGSLNVGSKMRIDKRRDKALRKGAFVQSEGRQDTSNPEALVFVQALPVVQPLITIVLSVLRNITNDIKNRTPDNWNEGLSFIWGNGTLGFEIQYYPNATSVPINVANVPVPTISNSYYSFAELIAAQLETLYLTHTDISLYAFRIGFDLDVVFESYAAGMKCELNCVQSLTIHNKSNIDTPTELSNSPVVIHTYSGNGNGPRPKFHRLLNYTSYAGDKESGLAIYKPLTTSSSVGVEPFSAKSFTNCKGGVVLNMNYGEIKKSTVSYNGKKSLHSMFKLLIGTGIGSVQRKFGYYRMFHFETLMNTGTPSCKLTYEYDLKTSAITKLSKSKGVMPEESTLPPTLPS